MTIVMENELDEILKMSDLEKRKIYLNDFLDKLCKYHYIIGYEEGRTGWERNSS